MQISTPSQSKTARPSVDARRSRRERAFSRLVLGLAGAVAAAAVFAAISNGAQITAQVTNELIPRSD